LPNLPPKNLTVATTGASGSLFLKQLLVAIERDKRVHTVNFIASDSALRVMAEELGLRGRSNLVSQLLGKASSKIHQQSNADIGANIASGSYPADAMVVIPCSVGRRRYRLPPNPNLLQSPGKLGCHGARVRQPRPSPHRPAPVQRLPLEGLSFSVSGRHFNDLPWKRSDTCRGYFKCRNTEVPGTRLLWDMSEWGGGNGYQEVQKCSRRIIASADAVRTRTSHAGRKKDGVYQMVISAGKHGPPT
jgi:hypothetical protein